MASQVVMASQAVWPKNYQCWWRRQWRQSRKTRRRTDTHRGRRWIIWSRLKRRLIVVTLMLKRRSRLFKCC